MADSFIFYGYVNKDDTKPCNIVILGNRIITSNFIKTIPSIEKSHIETYNDKSVIDKSVAEFYYGGKLPRVPESKIESILRKSEKTRQELRWYVLIVDDTSSILAEVEKKPAKNHILDISVGLIVGVIGIYLLYRKRSI